MIGGGMLLFVVLFLVFECFCKIDEFDLENYPQPMVGVMQGQTNDGNLENQLPSHPVTERVVQREPSWNQTDKISGAIMSRSVVWYKNGEAIESCRATDCVVCLEEFKDGDFCRVLPNCKHLYHRFCIDEWLVKNRHCPLCRDSVHNSDRTQSTLSH
ncbi:hypothetical protein V6N11_054036 [Hibiscus sabdariffa]|uniref:RING-type domain-containing protein n=1 Tax=Hibiscus sabdariffa TaxID=183260 RepID=A0ABR2S2N3_9ROSI